MQPASVPEKNQRTGFLDLPPELRKRMYEIVLHGGTVYPSQPDLYDEYMHHYRPWVAQRV